MTNRRINTRVVLDMVNGFQVLEREAFDYSGPLALCDGPSVAEVAGEVTKTVMPEIKAIGETSKKNWDSLNRGFEELKKLVDEKTSGIDPLVQEKVNKLATDIATRQKAMDDAVQKANERMDQVEVMFKRGMGTDGGVTKDEEAKEFKDAWAWKQQCYIIHGQFSHQVKQEEVKLDEYRQYKEALVKWMRSGFQGGTMSPEFQKALSVGSDPDGGILVTPQMSSRIIEWVFQVDPVRELATVETIGTDRLEILKDLEEAGSGFETETVAQNPTATPQLFKKSIPVYWQSARPRATQQVLDDASINLETWLANKVYRRFARGEGSTFVTGTGAGQPRGFLSYGNGTTDGTIQRTNLGHATLPTTNGLIDLKFSLLEEYLARATWVVNRLTVAETMKLKDGDGQYIWRPGLQEAQPSLLLGHPLRMATSMPIVAANALSYAIADWKEAYTVVDRAGITIQRDPYTVKPFVEFYTRRRVGGDVVNFQAIKIGVIHV